MHNSGHQLLVVRLAGVGEDKIKNTWRSRDGHSSRNLRRRRHQRRRRILKYIRPDMWAMLD